MAKSKLNESSPDVIGVSFLEQNPDGLEPAAARIVVANHIPEYRDVVFQNGRDAGVALMFHYSSATHPLHNYTLFHGHKHKLPVEVIEHLESCREPQYGYRKNPEGHPECYVTGYKYIFSFRNK